jgi:hypothetical protein
MKQYAEVVSLSLLNQSKNDDHLDFNDTWGNTH